MPFLLKEFGRCELVIGGSGSMETELRQLIIQLHLEHCIKLVGYVEDVWQFLSMIDIFVLPSLSEGLPISLLEAMAFGKPVVASAVGGIPEVILSSEEGVLIPPGDPATIAKAVAMLLRQPEKMDSMGTLAREVVRRRFSAEVMAAKYLKLYSRLTYES
jgi:glycosyltransferase involved in cell wall biosynthesis